MARVIQIKCEHAKKLLEGVKTTSIRLGVHRIEPGEVFIHSCGRVLAKAEVKGVRVKRIKEINDEDAIKDGFRNREELLSVLKELYGREIPPNKLVTIIEFGRVEGVEPTNPEDPYGGVHPQVIAKKALRELGGSLTKEEIRVLEMVARTGSIRETAQRLYGSWRRRHSVRLIVRRALDMLIKNGVLTGEQRDAGGSK